MGRSLEQLATVCHLVSGKQELEGRGGGVRWRGRRGEVGERVDDLKQADSFFQVEDI
jgi:hypothetical protein